MSVHTIRQRSALQRLQQRSQHPRRRQLHLVPPPAQATTWLDRAAEHLWRLHDSRWPWLLAAALILTADAFILTSTLPWCAHDIPHAR